MLDDLWVVIAVLLVIIGVGSCSIYSAGSVDRAISKLVAGGTL